MKFEKLKLAEWKQFGNIEIKFHPKLTILTGANSSGKTTVLNILARHFGWHGAELSTPTKDKETGIIGFAHRIFGNYFLTNKNHKIGEIFYDGGSETNLEIPNNGQVQTHIHFSNIGSVLGVNIPSHRPYFHYQPLSQISLQKRNKEDAYNLVKNSNQNRLGGGSDKAINYYIKETLITWGVYGFGNEKIVSDREQIDFYNGFEAVLQKMLPQSIGFKSFSIRNSEVVLVTDSGEFMIDAVSGGVSAIIDLSWQIFMYSTKERQEFVVLIDEIENHLHPTLQRQILPNLLSTFPKVQFIVSTHNPLIIGSVKDSNVYAFQYNTDRKVDSVQLDLINKSKTASDILRDVLDVPFTMPLWVEADLNLITERYSKVVMTSENFENMRSDLRKIGLEDLMPQAMTKVLLDK